MKLKLTILSLLLLFTISSFSQKISNIHFEQVGKQIHIYYDLEGDQEYSIQVFCSTDNGQSWGEQLKKVSGAVGEEQEAGDDLMIVWNVLYEREKLMGEIKFKINAINNFTGESGNFFDSRDGQIYNWIRVGNQIWMAENLRFKTKNGCWVYNNDSINRTLYGQLYDWHTALRVCPKGWHLPSINEWGKLIKFMGGEGVAGGKMKIPTENQRIKRKKEIQNTSGFSVLLSGKRLKVNKYFGEGKQAFYWSSSESTIGAAMGIVLNYNNSNVIFDGIMDTNSGQSIRCLKD